MVPKTHETDILILGSGGAGLFAALHANKADPGLAITVAVLIRRIAALKRYGSATRRLIKVARAADSSCMTLRRWRLIAVRAASTADVNASSTRHSAMPMA